MEKDKEQSEKQGSIEGGGTFSLGRTRASRRVILGQPLAGVGIGRPYTQAQIPQGYAKPGWNDILIDLSAGKGVGANAPTWTAFVGGVSAYSFSASTMNEVWVSFHIPHDYKTGTAVYPHIHWVPSSTNTGVCRWGIEYTYARGYSVEAFPATTTIYLEQAGSGTTSMHQVIEVTTANAITLTNCEPDLLVLCRVFRDAAHANDTFTGIAFGLFIDLHYESDGKLTNERNRTFTKREY